MWSEAQRLKSDILCIQETNFHAAKVPKCSHRLYLHVFFANAEAKRNGVLIAIKNTIAFTLYEILTDLNGCYIILVCTLNNVMYTIVSVYAPNQGQLSLRKLFSKVKSGSKGTLLLLGNFTW